MTSLQLLIEVAVPILAGNLVINEVEGNNRIVCDITSKPPAAIRQGQLQETVDPLQYNGSTVFFL